MRRRERALLAELALVQAEINAAYWAFCRQARALPPVLAVPDAYRRKKELERALEALRARRRTRF